MLLHTSTALLTSNPDNQFVKNAAVHASTATSHKPSFKPDTFVLRHYALVSWHEGSLNLVARAGRSKAYCGSPCIIQ